MDEATSEPLPPPPEKPLNGDEQQLASLRSRYYALAAKVAERKLTLEEALAEADKRDSRPKSGFARLKNRTAKVYAELNDCKAALARKDQDIDTLGGEVDGQPSFHG